MAAQVGNKRARMQTEDLLYVLRNDKKKYTRAIDLLKSLVVTEEATKEKNLTKGGDIVDNKSSV